jgi:hypothetical protein
MELAELYARPGERLRLRAGGVDRELHRCDRTAPVSE